MNCEFLNFCNLEQMDCGELVHDCNIEQMDFTVQSGQSFFNNYRDFIQIGVPNFTFLKQQQSSPKDLGSKFPRSKKKITYRRLCRHTPRTSQHHN